MNASGDIQRLAAVALTLAFVAVALVVEIAGELPGDERALVELEAAFGTTLDDSMVAVGQATDRLPIAIAWAIVTVGLVRTGRRREAVLFLIVVVVAMLGNALLKQVFERPRPDIRPHPETTSTFSFPSGHAANTLSLLAGMAICVPRSLRLSKRQWRALLALGAAGVVLVGFSRLAVGVHYPSDVIAAWLWVGAWALLVRSVGRSPSAAQAGTTV